MRFFFTFAIAFFLFACGSGNNADQQLVGQWKFAHVDASGVPGYSGDPQSQVHVSMMETAMQEMTYEFSADQSFVFQMPSGHGTQIQKGHYEIIDGQSLRMTKTAGESKTMTIEKVTADSLVLEENGVRMFFGRKQ